MNWETKLQRRPINSVLNFSQNSQGTASTGNSGFRTALSNQTQGIGNSQLSVSSGRSTSKSSPTYKRIKRVENVLNSTNRGLEELVGNPTRQSVRQSSLVEGSGNTNWGSEQQHPVKRQWNDPNPRRERRRLLRVKRTGGTVEVNSEFIARATQQLRSQRTSPNQAGPSRPTTSVVTIRSRNTGLGAPTNNAQSINRTVRRSEMLQSIPMTNTGISSLSKENIENIRILIRDIIEDKVKQEYIRQYPTIVESFRSFFDSKFVADYSNTNVNAFREHTVRRSSWSNYVSMDIVIPSNRLDLVKDYLVCQFADTYHDGNGEVPVYGKTASKLSVKEQCPPKRKRGERGGYVTSIKDAGSYIAHLFDSWIGNAKRGLGFHTKEMIPVLEYMKTNLSDFKCVDRHKAISREEVNSKFDKIIREDVYGRGGEMPSSGWERKFLYGSNENGGALKIIKDQFTTKFQQKKYPIQNSVQNVVNAVKDSHGIVIDMSQQAHGGARRVYGEWKKPKLLHISSLDDAGQGLLGENKWMNSIINQFIYNQRINENLDLGSGQHKIDFKPFSFRMFYQYINPRSGNKMNIPILSIQIQVDVDAVRNGLVRKNSPLSKVTINGIDGFKICSKTEAYKNNNNTMRKRCANREDSWHLQLMQKYIGDFLPIVYSFAKDSYYTTGDNMAIVQYLNMARLLKDPEVATRIVIFGNDPNVPIKEQVFTPSSAKFKILAEDGGKGFIRLFVSTSSLLRPPSPR
jgi:hypothetical protein